MHDINDYLYTWNPKPAARLTDILIEDDIREALQAAFVSKPTLAERMHLVELSAAVGTHVVILGFPAISAQEYEECRALLAHIEHQKLPVAASFLARLLLSDVEPIAALKREFPALTLQAETFLCTSPLRAKVENWNFADMLARISRVGEYLAEHQVKFCMSLEDATRTPNDRLAEVMTVALGAQIKAFAICDTVGECTPEGAARITEFVRQQIHASGKTVQISWHGHNDKGLAVANAMAAAAAGADMISGTFLGIGERSGNAALEQVVLLLAQAGNRRYDLTALNRCCQTLAEYVQMPIAVNMPIVGAQAFSTTAGTHSAAILKARALGTQFEDHVFSGVAASDLGRVQEVLIGPVSGGANARFVFEQLQQESTPERVDALLRFAKAQARCMTQQDVADWLQAPTI